MNSSKKAYFPLMFSPFASQLGSAIYVLGLNWLLVRVTGNTKLLGLIEGLGGLAFLLGDFLVGLLVDQYNRKKVFDMDRYHFSINVLSRWLLRK